MRRLALVLDVNLQQGSSSARREAARPGGFHFLRPSTARVCADVFVNETLPGKRFASSKFEVDGSSSSICTYAAPRIFASCLEDLSSHFLDAYFDFPRYFRFSLRHLPNLTSPLSSATPIEGAWSPWRLSTLRSCELTARVIV